MAARQLPIGFVALTAVLAPPAAAAEKGGLFLYPVIRSFSWVGVQDVRPPDRGRLLTGGRPACHPAGIRDIPLINCPVEYPAGGRDPWNADGRPRPLKRPG